LILVTSLFAILLETPCWSKNMSLHRYVVFGERRADADYKNNLFYVYNDFALPLIANVQTIQQEQLLKDYFHQDLKHQRVYLSAFVSGYHDELMKIKGNAIISQSPLITTFVEYIRRYARDHKGNIPTFRGITDLISQLKNEYLGIDIYAGTRIRYGVNKHISGTAISLLHGNTVIAWVIPNGYRGSRCVGFANGEVHTVSPTLWKTLAKQQNL
jgi:hypothetical protein